jgi:IclR family acetate operon transcriptional repressor
MRMFTEVGHRAKVHTTAVGKVMLSTRSDQYVRDVLRRTGMERLTEHTITTPEAFLADLERVRSRGYAIDHGEQEVGVCCVAVPVPMAPRPMALSMSGPLPRMTDEMIARAVPLLREAASRISADLAGPASLSEVEVTA